MTFGYDSKWAFSPSTADIKDFALDLLNRLRSKRWSVKVSVKSELYPIPLDLQGQAMRRPIVFICHSLGGIVCKKVHSFIPILPDQNK